MPGRLCLTSLKSFISARSRSGQCVRSCAVLICLVAAVSSPAQPETITSQDFGSAQVGATVPVSITVSGLSSPTLSLRYSTDYSLGACTPSGNNCSLAVTFKPIKPGLRQDAVVVKDGSGQIVEEILLHGIGLGPLPVFSPAFATYKALLPGFYLAFGVTGMSAEPNGKILVLLGATGTVYEFDPATNNLNVVLAVPAGTPPWALQGLASDAAGNIFYEDPNSGLHRLDIVTGTNSVFASTVFPTDIIVAPTGAIFYSQGSQVFKIDPNTQAITVVAGNGTQGYAGDGGAATNAEFDFPWGIAFDPAG